MQLYQFLLKNNEQTQNFHQGYKMKEDKKIQKIMQEYISMVKIDTSSI